MEDWKQRSKTLMDQIHAVDPYYVPTNEYRFIGQASYADIAAGRTNSPSSRNCSPYSYQREITPPTMTAQILQPAVMRAQKLTMEYPSSLDEAQVSKTQTQEDDINLNKSKSQQQIETHVQTTKDQDIIDAEECHQQAVLEVTVESSVPHRGRSPTRKNSSRVRDSKMMEDQEGEIDRHDNLRPGANSRQEMESVKNTLAPREERRGRSPSPMWIPGSTSYADILRGCIQTTQVNTILAQPFKQKMISEEFRCDRAEIPRAEQVNVDIVTNVDKSQQVTEIQQIVPMQEIQVENVQIAEIYCQSPEISTEKAEDQSYAESEPTNWTDETLQDYNVLQHVKPYENVPRQSQSTEMYDYMIPETMPELVGFIGSHLGTYPVSSYVYAPSDHHQQVQQVDSINMNSYNNGSLTYTPEHYVAQTAYLSASDIYQQTPMQQPIDDMGHTTAVLVEKSVEMPVVRQLEVSKDVIATESIDKLELQKSVNDSNIETSTNKTGERNTLSINNVEIKGQTFSYAQILSHGLNSRVTSTSSCIINESPTMNYQNKERSDSPKESLELSSRELSPLQESKFEQDSQSFAIISEQSRQCKENDWDTMKKREIRKRQQQPNERMKQMNERKPRKFIDKSKEKQKKEKLSPPKQLETQDESIFDKISHSSTQKEENSVQQEKPAVDLDTNPSNPEKKHKRQKKKKVDKSIGDEIDKALKEIEDMDKQKTKYPKDKSKEQNKEIKSRDSVIETIEKYKADKKQSKSSDKSKKSGKSKEATRIKETMSMEHATLPSQIKASDQNILKDNAENKEDTKDAKISDSKNEEEIQKNISKEMLKNQLQIDDNKISIENQLNVLSNNKKDKINIVKENNVTEVIKLSVTQEIELENTNEKTNTPTKIESTKKGNKDGSKKEKNKIKLKELKLEAEDNNINQEKLEINTKGIIKDESLESIKPLIDIGIKDFDSKTLEVTKITSDVNENTKSKTPKKDKVCKNKIKSETTIDTSSTVSTNKILDEIKINLNDTEKYDVVLKSEQMIDETKIAETAVIVEEPPKEIILLPKTIQEIVQENDVLYKNDKTYDSAGIKELTKSKETEQTNVKLEVESFTRENLEITDTMDEKKVINSDTKIIAKTEKLEVEKCQIKTTKHKKSEKTKSNVQDKNKRKKDNTEISQRIENKSAEKNNEFIESLIAPTIETVVQEQKSNLTEQNVSESNSSCLIQSKTDAENNYGIKIDEGENIAFGQVNKYTAEIVPKSKKKGKSKDKVVIQSTAVIHDTKFTEKSKLKDVIETAASAIVELVTINEESHNETVKLTKDDAKSEEAFSTEKLTTVPEMDLAISTSENIKIISTTETLPKESEVFSEINDTILDIKEKYQNIKNGKLDQKTIIKNEDIKIDINDKDFLLKEQKKLEDITSKEKTSKRTKRKERLSPKHTVEQTRQSSSFYDKFQEEIIFKDDLTKRQETPKIRNLSSFAKIDNVDIEKTQESSKKDEAKFGSKVSKDSVNKAQIHEKHIDETHNNLESDQPSSIGKALIIEKMITTVTTTTSVPGSTKVKPPDVKSIKSIEIIENIPLPKIVGSKVTELITLRPETVEASLTTTYARIPNDSLVDSYSQSDQAAISQKVGLTSAISTENIVISDELALFGSVQDRRRACSGISESRDISKETPPTPKEIEGEFIVQLHDNMEGSGDQLKVKVPEEKQNDNIKKENTITITPGIIVVDTISQNDNIIENQNINNSVKNDNIVLNDKTSETDSNILIEEKDKCINGNKVNVVDTIAKNVQEKVTDEKIEFEIKCESKCTINKIKNKEISEGIKTKKQIMPEYLLDLIKPYAMDRHTYNHAESNFYRYFKVIKIIKEAQPSTVIVQTRPESIERIVQESVMKPVKSASQETSEVNYRKHALITEAPKYPIASFYEFESQWIKRKSIPEKSVSISSDDSEISVKTAIGREKQTVEEKEAINAVSDLTEETIAFVEKLETNDSKDKDKKSINLQQSVHLVSDDSWMSILDEPIMIEDDFDDTFNPEENVINETINKELIDVESQDRTNKVQVKEKQLSKAISEALEVSSCIESLEKIQEPAITLISTSANNISFTVIDLINTTNDSISQPITELNESPIESAIEKLSDNQLIDAKAITDANIQENKTVIKNNTETKQERMLEFKATPTKIPSVHQESDDAWVAFPDEEIIIDDDFDELETETIKDEIKKSEEHIKKEEAKTKQQIEEEEIEKKKPIIEKQEDKVEQKERTIKEQKEKIEKEAMIAKLEVEIKEKKAFETCEEETKEQKTEILNSTSLTEIAVKDEYHTSMKDIQNKVAMDEKQSNKTKNQPRKKKESKHIKVTKTKDQVKAKTAEKQSDVEIKTDECDLSSLQSNLEERKMLEDEIDSKTKETEKSSIANKQLVASHRENNITSKLPSGESTSKLKSEDTIEEEYEKSLSKREERKLKSDKKSKKQNQKLEITLKEKSVTVKHENNIKKDDNIVLSTATEIESDIFETSSIVQEQELKNDMHKYDRLNPNAKSWAAIVGRNITETTSGPKNDFLNTQTSAIICQDTNDSVTNIVKQPQAILHDSCEILSKEEGFTNSSSLENQLSENVIEESKATVVDEIKLIAEKSTVPSKQLKESNKSYAQVTAYSRISPRLSPQISQEETYSELNKSIPLRIDHLPIDVKTTILDKEHEDFITEKLQSAVEQNNKQDEIIVQQSYDHQTVIANLISQEESIPWVEEVEKETLTVSTTSVSSTNTRDNETYAKPENTWAAIVGKKSVELPEVNDITNFESNLPKSEQITEQWSPMQIYVEEAPKQEPIENLIQVDEQGFMEYVNRKELRSRRSRSRSRSARQENKYAIVETSNSIRNKEITALDKKSESNEDVKAKEETENEIKQSVLKHENIVDESEELTMIIKEENAESKKAYAPKSKDRDKQKNEQNNENKMQFAENKNHVESKIIQERKSELGVTLKGKKNKSKNKSGKDDIKQQTEVNEQKESEYIEKSKEDEKSANENEIAYSKIQLENIKDQSIKETQLIEDTKHAQENKCKNVKTLSIIDQDNTIKSKKKKNKKGKFVIEQLSESISNINKKTAGDLEKKTESPVESKLDDEIKLKLEKAITTDITCNIPSYPENEKTSAKKINKQEKQVMITETLEQESIEQKMIVDESKNAVTCKESHSEEVKNNVMEEKETPKLTKAEKRKQKKRVKTAQSKSINSSDDINIVENKETIKVIKETANTAPMKDEINNESIIEIQSVQIKEIEKPLKKSEVVIENKTSQITPIKDKQKPKSKSKSKKEKRQQEDKTKSQNVTIFTTESKEIETLSTAENTEIINLNKDILVRDIMQTKTENVKGIQVLNAELSEILQSPKDIIDKNDFSIAPETIKQKDIKESKENVPETEEVFADNSLIILTEKTELPQIEEFKSDNTSKLYDITDINNDILKIESEEKSDKTYNSTDEIEIDTSTPNINHVCMQIESSCDSINAIIKHSPPSDKLSSTVQQSVFEDEDKLKRIASALQQESFDILVEPPKSKVRFYIADEILVLNPDRRKYVPSTSFLQEQSTTDLCNSWFLFIDDSFWPGKRSYHEAERDYFENLALLTKKSLSRDDKRDSDDRHRPRDRDDDNSGGGGGSSRSWDSCGNSGSLLGTPQTERMIADLPGGICSWSDYSTYLSSESERTMDHSLPFGTIEDSTFDSALSLDYSLPNDIQSSSPKFLSSFPPSHDLQSESRMEFLANAEVILTEYPIVSCSNNIQSPDHPSTCTRSSTFAHLPQSKLHLGKETREGSVQQCSPNGEVERETTKGEAERIRRIQVRSPSQPVLGLVLVQANQVRCYMYIYMYMYIYLYLVIWIVYHWFFALSVSHFVKRLRFHFLVRIQCVRFSCVVDYSPYIHKYIIVITFPTDIIIELLLLLLLLSYSNLI